MDKLKDIRQLNTQERREFLDSFDIIITDCDGVLWWSDTPIGGALDTLKMLQYLGKKVIFVSNNTSRSIESYVSKLSRMGYHATADQIITPSLSIAWYLKRIGFNKKVMAIASQAFIKVLMDDGVDVITGPKFIEENMATIRELLLNQPDIGAVIVDFDVNLNFIKMAQVVMLLEKKDILFLVGTRDYKIPLSKAHEIMGPGAYVDVLINLTGRTPIEYAKPSTVLRDYVFERYEIYNPKRCLFVGDSLNTDMKFAELCGFKKLWVDSGVDKIDVLHSGCVIPDYYLPNLGLMPSFENS